MDRRMALLTLACSVPATGALMATPAAAQWFGGGMDQFRMQALQGGEFSLQSSQLAAQRASNPRIRQSA